MKSKFAALALLFAALFTMVSCLESSDSGYTYTDDSALSSFTVNTAKRYLYTKSSKGEDSLYTEEVTLDSYKFYIDQANRKIYNPDSLPCGVDARKLLCTVSAYSGTALIKNVDSDTLNYINSSDSIDFSVPREIQVVSTSGQGLRKYEVEVRVHKELPDSFYWKEMPECELMRGFTGVKVVALDGGRLLMLGSDGEGTDLLVNENGAWRTAVTNWNHRLAAEAYRGVVTKDGRAYLSDGGDIMSTADGEEWTVTGQATGITRLVAASIARLYGYSADGRLMASADNGATWTVATIDDELTLLPDGETSYTTIKSETNKNTERVLLVGTRADNSQMLIWGKVDEAGYSDESQPWSFFNPTSDNKHRLPNVENVSVVKYDSAVWVLGNEADKAATFYKTTDGGITWSADTVLVAPDGIGVAPAAARQAGGNAYSLCVDGDSFLWMVDTKSGKTWRGRANRLGWKKEQTDFEE